VIARELLGVVDGGVSGGGNIKKLWILELFGQLRPESVQINI
jgi:hypothetical protein